MIGFEVELDRRVADASGSKIAGDRKLAICGGGEFTIVTDTRSAKQVDDDEEETDYSNIELVTQPFDQAVGLDAISAAVTHMNAFAAACYAIKKATNLDQVLKNSGVPYELTAEGITAIVHPDSDLIDESGEQYQVADKGSDSLFVHYTVGYPVGLLYDALDWVTSKTRPTADNDAARRFPITNAKRAARAAGAAAELFRRWAQAQSFVPTTADTRALMGYVALVYSQVAAMIDHADKHSEGQIKNRTVAVSRVPLRTVAENLPGPVREFLGQQAWVDMLNEYEVGPGDDDFTGFIGNRVDAAQEAVDDRQLDGSVAETLIPKLQGQVNDAKKKLAAINLKIASPAKKTAAQVRKLQQDRIKALKRLYKVEEELEQRQDHLVYYQNAVQACQQWKAVQSLPGDLSLLNTARIKDLFPWSVISHAIVPALEGRQLAADLTKGDPDALFIAAVRARRGPDGGRYRNLATELVTDLGGVDVMLGDILYSTLLAPCQPPIWQTMIFGGMHEVPAPDVLTVSDGRTCRLIPLELRSYGQSRVSWNQLADGIKDIAQKSVELMQAALPPVVHDITSTDAIMTT